MGCICNVYRECECTTCEWWGGRRIEEGFLEEVMLMLEVKGQIELARCTGRKRGEGAPTWRTGIPPTARDRGIWYHD